MGQRLFHHCLLLLLLPLACFLLPASSAPTCQTFSSTFCNDVISSYPSGQVYGDPLFLSITEGVISSQFAELSVIGPVVFPSCYEKARRFICGNFFPECKDSAEHKICRSVCDEFEEKCAFLIFGQGLNGSYPSCSSFPTTNCSVLPNLVPLDPATIECPAPLVKNPHPEIPLEFCPGDGYCCVPCPASYYFFKEGVMRRVSRFITACNLINFFLCLSVLVAYLIIPSKRQFPFTMITAMCLAISIAYVYTWIRVFVQEESLLCYDMVTPSRYDTITPSCRAMGIIFIYGTLTAILWFAAFAFNVFFVMTSGRGTVHSLSYVYHAVCWILPIISVVVLDTKQQFGMDFMPFCGVPDAGWADATIFIPSAFFIFPAFASNIFIFIKFFLVARRVKKSIFTILQLQMRPLIFSTYCLTAFIMYWMYVRFYHTGNEWLQEWFTCIALGRGQDECSKISAPEIRLGGIVVVYFIISTFGLAGFLVFFLKKDVLESLARIILRKELSTFTTDYTKSSSHRTHTAGGGREEVQISKSAKDPKEDEDEVDMTPTKSADALAHE